MYIELNNNIASRKKLPILLKFFSHTLKIFGNGASNQVCIVWMALQWCCQFATYFSDVVNMPLTSVMWSICHSLQWCGQYATSEMWSVCYFNDVVSMPLQLCGQFATSEMWSICHDFQGTFFWHLSGLIWIFFTIVASLCSWTHELVMVTKAYI